MNFTRRNFLTRFGIGALTTGLITTGIPVRADNCQTQRVNGVGSSRLGPFDPVKKGNDPVYLLSDLGFDETLVFCKVTTNFAAFIFPTVRMGIIYIPGDAASEAEAERAVQLLGSGLKAGNLLFTPVHGG